jgi:hypothetical protein
MTRIYESSRGFLRTRNHSPPLTLDSSFAARSSHFLVMFLTIYYFFESACFPSTSCMKWYRGRQVNNPSELRLGGNKATSNLTRLRNEAPALRNRQEFQRSQHTELASTDFESWAKESFEIATKIAYRNGGRIGSPRGGNKDCTTVVGGPVLPVGYVVNAKRIADSRGISPGRPADTGHSKL